MKIFPVPAALLTALVLLAGCDTEQRLVEPEPELAPAEGAFGEEYEEYEEDGP